MKIPAVKNGTLRHTPIQAAIHGAAAGLAATLLLSALARVLPGMGMDPKPGERKGDSKPPPPQDTFDPPPNLEQQGASSSLAADPPAQGKGGEDFGGPPTVTPAGALSRPQAPGPEGLAEQFSFKVASGIFGRDITPYMRPIGMATHLTYGSLWGTLYGLLQASYRRSPRLSGGAYGLMVWAVGPAFLVPAMKLLHPLSEEPPLRTGMMAAGHIAYGIALAEAFERLERETERAA
jgi:uncharacterized membrane protein YagU involved in acid resistance